MEETTVGKLLIKSILPPDVYVDKEFDNKTMDEVLTTVAKKYPEKFPEISSKLLNLGADLAFRSGGPALKFEDFKPSTVAQNYRHQLLNEINSILMDQRFDDNEKKKRILNLTAKYDDIMMNEILKEQEQLKSTPYLQFKSGARGNKLQLRRIYSGDMIYVDNRNEPIPFPVVKSYSEGLSPAEYWAATYGARRGWADTNLGTAIAGYLSKQLSYATHDLIITAVDQPYTDPLPRGLPVNIDDPDNVGSFLATDVGNYKRNTLLTPEILADLQNQGINQILIRSPAVKLNKGPGLLARDVGLVEGGRLLSPGDMIGILSAQAIGEPITQRLISSKHTGGVKKNVSSVDILQRLLQVPKRFPESITYSSVSGTVDKIEKSPIGGNIVYVNNIPHYVEIKNEVTVKPGDVVEEGDPLSTGIPNPAKIVMYKGLGEGRKQFIDAFRKWLQDEGMNINRKNVEVLAAGLLDYVVMTDRYENWLPNEYVRYSALEKYWKPREDTKWVPVENAVGKYLELPVLHLTIGTKILPSFVNLLKKFKINMIPVNDNPPPFRPVAIPLARTLDYNKDWLVRFLGGTRGPERNILQAVQFGEEADIYGTSFVPPLAIGKPYGVEWPRKVVSNTPE